MSESVKAGNRSLGKLLQLVCTTYGIDFSRYRFTCVGRRVSHRMTTLGYSDLEEYMEFLRDNPGEMDALLNAVTIHVTGFFRDKEVFDSLSRIVLPRIVEGKLAEKSRNIRIWSAGCATGEETYSLAVLFTYLLNQQGHALNLEVFGTDISEESCRIARKGVYPKQKLSDMPVRMKVRYFDVVEEGLQISPEIRRLVKFRVHDLFSAPPYSMLDLVVCRNVMIHFDHNARGNIIMNFNNVLVDGGILILGKSEAVTGDELELFEMVDPRSKVYRKRARIQGGTV
jgi:two-component system CheB/CheR fusion protein